MSTGILSARVRQGIALMDIHHGQQWVWGVDPDTLNIRSGRDCILGQYYSAIPRRDGEYYTPWLRGLAAFRMDGLDDTSAYACGFDLDPDVDSGFAYCALTRIWAYAIRRLREQRPQEVAA